MRRSNNSRSWLAPVWPALLAACTAPAEPPPASGASSCLADGNGFVTGELFGGVETALDWSNDNTVCEGMPRPKSDGARLRFAGQTGDTDLVIIVGVTGLARNTIGNGLAANVTIIDETHQRIFSNGGVPNCWADVYRQVAAASGDDPDRTYIDGVVYCSGALAGRQTDGSVRIRDLKFRGQVLWRVDPAVATTG